jgi:hypothetical protein
MKKETWSRMPSSETNRDEGMHVPESLGGRRNSLTLFSSGIKHEERKCRISWGEDVKTGRRF